VDVPLPPLGSGDALVRVLRGGVCGTDCEIIEGHLGAAPDGDPHMVIGHEFLGVVEEIGSSVTSLKSGDLVTATARRGCGCPACVAGESDFCSALAYKERGIVGLHGYFTERFVESECNLVLVPAELEAIGVLVEPLSVPEKVWRIANGVQSRIRSWSPKTAVVYGAGPIGLLATLMLRAKGLEVHALDLKPAPNANAEIVEQSGAIYHSAAGLPIDALKRDLSNVDLIVECTGSSAPLADAMHLLGNNGVLALLSVTGGAFERTIPADRLYREFVLGNKTLVGSVNSSIADFNAAVADLQRFNELWPGLAASMITHRLPNLEAALGLPAAANGSVKTVIEIS
jgi:threonine dehydrogenase-like Zn-dependent dehydrogenase